MSQVACAAEKSKFISITRQISNWTEQILGVGFRKYSSEQTWTPSVNLCEHEGYYCLIVELAGMSAEGIDLRVEEDKGVLVLSGDRPVPKGSNEDDMVCLHLMEIDHGRFSRALDLPEDVDPNGIEAKYCLGYLWVKMPKK